MPDSHSATPASASSRPNRLIAVLLLGALLLATGEAVRRWITPEFDPPVTTVWNNRLVESEGLILELTPRLKEQLGTSVLNLSLPDVLGTELFADSVTVRDLVNKAPEEKKKLPDLAVRKYSWSVADAAVATPRSELSLWKPVFESVSYFERAGFKFVRSYFDDEDSSLLHSEVTFEGLARDQDGQLILVKAEQNLSWRPLPSPESDPPVVIASNQKAAPSVATGRRRKPGADDYRIVEWTQTSLDTIHAPRTFFSETLDQYIPDEDLRHRLRDSLHERYILDRYAALSKREQWQGPHPYFSVVSQDRHPSISVVDIDQDGLDDLYVMARWGRNILLHNEGGYFVDVARQYGLDIDGHCASAIFADFDNDGDPDLLLGRTLVPSQYLVNENGVFVDRTDTLVDGDLPSLVTSASAADYNGDGLLDIYLATYAANMQDDELRMEGPTPQNPDAPGLLTDFLPEPVAVELQDRLEDLKYHRHLNNYGPPNLLLVNRGGRFEPAPENEQVEAWRHTYQASWNDFDLDGDPDLYLANDFAVNSLMRNDGEAGFVDVAEETGTTDIGFGMGASWGDYDNDGRADLYVSNMFSKAGRRITGSLKDIDERFGLMARGNSLFHNDSTSFRKVSGLDAPALQVEKAGWSWSGQFVDFDNDGWLDVHALSGYYSAPSEVAVQVDL